VLVEQHGIVGGDDPGIGVTDERCPRILGDQLTHEVGVPDGVLGVLAHWRQYRSVCRPGWVSVEPGKLRRVAEALEELIVSDGEAWREWLAVNHARSVGVWLVLAKRGTCEPTALGHDEALEEAISFGWIDGQVGRRDERTFRQRFTPRRARSRWSERNAKIAERLQGEGRMCPAGLTEMEAAKADGRWESAYPGQRSIEVPDDLAAALAAEPRAQAMFEILSSQNRYSVLYRLHQVKRADTRARRIEQFVAMLARGETVHPQKRKLEH